jgi:DNA-binding CsgD family transcriptional regulator
MTVHALQAVSGPPASLPSAGLAILLLTDELILRNANLNGWALLRDRRLFLFADGKVQPATPRMSSFMRTLLARANDEGYRAVLLDEAEDGHGGFIFSSRRVGGDASSNPLFFIASRATDLAEPLHGAEVMDIFGLTSAEARVTLRLAAGLSLHEIADDSGVSINTVRAQLRSIYAKTGVTKQSQLVATIWRIASV